MSTLSSEQCNIIQFTGSDRQNNGLTEWCDDETDQHCIQIERDMRGLPDIYFYFETQEKAHELFNLLLEAKTIEVDGDGPDDLTVDDALENPQLDRNDSVIRNSQIW